MAAVFGALAENHTGTSHRTQEGERSPWDFSTPINQEVRLRFHAYAGLHIAATTQIPLPSVPLARMFLPLSPL